MISQGSKELLWMAMTPALKVSHLLASLHFRNARGLCLQLGAGGRPLAGFINVDINPTRHPDVWLDIRGGLPFPEASASFIYTSHTLEHLQLDRVMRVLGECHRVLCPQGTLRIAVPNLRKAISNYHLGDEKWFGSWPRNFKSLGGRFVNYAFCEAQHKCAFDHAFLDELLSSCGFPPSTELEPGKSLDPAHYLPRVAEFERSHLDDRSLLVEVQKGA
jgi:predicted SAM-dependent methyltransferase